MRKKLLLLSPPYKKLKLMKDYICSHTSKSSYLYPALDLLVLSGVFSKDYEVSNIDSIADNLSHKETYEKIEKIKPGIIVALTGVISYKEDLKFLKRLREKFKSKIFLIGDITYFKPRTILEKYDFVDGIILDFISKDLIDFMEGRKADLEGVAYRTKKGIRVKYDTQKKFSLPLPLYDLFPLKKYSLPFGRYTPLTAVLTSYGCPYNCSYCIYSKMPYKERDIDNLISELKHIESKGIREFIFKDTAFNTNPGRSKEICRRMIDEKIKLAWSCDVTVANCDMELLSLMKRAGCYLVMVGVESVDDKILKNVRKPSSSEKITEFFETCKKAGMQTLAHFIFGLPGDTEESINRTIEFSKKCGCDYTSFNMFIPKIGTDAREEMIRNKKIKKEDLACLDSTMECIDFEIPKQKLLSLHEKAIKEFYFKPSQMLKQVFLIRTWHQFVNLVKNGSRLFFGRRFND